MVLPFARVIGAQTRASWRCAFVKGPLCSRRSGTRGTNLKTGGKVARPITAVELSSDSGVEAARSAQSASFSYLQ
jgi:hypothetical protein